MTKHRDDWDDLDHAIYDAHIRRHMTWRAVAEEVGMTFGACRQRFLKAMSKVEQPEVEAYRKIEAEKLDEREAALWAVFTKAFEPPPQVTENGDEIPAKPDLQAAIQAQKTLDTVAKRRAALNGLDMPAQFEVKGLTRSFQDVVARSLADAVES